MRYFDPARRVNSAITAGVVLAAEKGSGDGYVIASEDRYSVLEISEMFGGKVEHVPVSPANRMDTPLDTSKIRQLGWRQVHMIEDYIGAIKRKGLRSTTVPQSGRESWAQMLDDGLPDLLVLSYLGRDQGLLAEEVVELAWTEVPRKARELGPTMRETLTRDVLALIGILSDLGIAQRSPDRLVLTPLGTWGVNRLLRDEGHDAPAFTDGPDADPASLLAYWGSLDVEGSALDDGVDAWLAGRSPESAVRALADAAAADVRLRGMFLYVLERMGPESADAVRGAGLERDPHLGPYVAAWFAGSGVGDESEPADEDLARVIGDQLAVLLIEGGPEALVEMLDGLGAPPEQAHFLEVLGKMQDADIARVLDAVAMSHPDPVVSRAARKAQLSGKGPEVRGARAAAPAPSSGRRHRAGRKSRKP